jgi:hypothetical protein
MSIKYIKKIPTLDKLRFAFQFSSLFSLKLILVILGVVLVPIGLLFKKKDFTKPVVIKVGGVNLYYRPFNYKMPNWLWIYGNDEEGLMSNFKPWWDSQKGQADSFWSMYKWAVFRNPVNNLRFTKMFQCDFIKCDHQVVVGDNSYYVKSTDSRTGKAYYSYRRRKWYQYKGQHVSSILHLGFKVLQHTITLYKQTPEVFTQPHHRYRGFSLQLIPRRGYIKR